MVRAGSVLAAIAVLLACAGCSTQGDPPEPTTGAVESPASSADPIAESSTEPDDDPATPAPTLPADLPEPLADLVTEPVYPEAAREFTHDGAAAFIQYVIDATDWAYATGSVDQLAPYCHDDSSYCSTVIDEARDLHASRYVRHGGRASVGFDTIELFEEESDALVHTTVEFERHLDLSEDNEVVSSGVGSSTTVLFHAEFSGDYWLLRAAGRQ